MSPRLVPKLGTIRGEPYLGILSLPETSLLAHTCQPCALCTGNSILPRFVISKAYANLRLIRAQFPVSALHLSLTSERPGAKRLQPKFTLNPEGFVFN